MKFLLMVSAALVAEALSVSVHAQARLPLVSVTEPPPPLISAAQVHRACAHPNLKNRSPLLYDACRLGISGPVDWTLWTRIGARAPELARDVVSLQAWTAGELSMDTLLSRVSRGPRARTVATALFTTVERERAPQLAAAVSTLDLPATQRIYQSASIRMRDLLGRDAPLLEGRAGIALQTIMADAVRSPSITLAEDLAAQPASVQRSLLAPFTTELTVDAFIEQYNVDANLAGQLRAEASEQSRASEVSAGPLAAALPLNQQSAILWGAASFVVSRAEQQMQTYFLQQFSSKFCLQHQAVLQSSCTILNGATLRNFRPGLGMLRQAVRQDLNALPATLIRTGIAQNVIPEQHWDAVNVAASGALFLVEVQRGTDPIQALRRVADSTLSVQVGERAAPVSRFLGQFAALQAGLLDPSGNLVSELPKELTREQQVQRLLLTFAINQPTYWPKLSFSPDRLAPVGLELYATVQQFRALKDTVVKLQRTVADTAAALRTARQSYMIATSQLADVLLESATRAGLSEAARLRSVVAPLRGIAIALVNADYATAALSAFELVAPYREVFKVTLPQGDMRVFSFVADLAQADDPAAVSAALSRIAGSGSGFQAKRGATEVRFTLNTYLGMYGGGLGGTSWAWGEELDDGRLASFVGPYLPVGIELTAPWPRVFGSRFGIFLQAVDLGALASWRLNDEEPTANQDSVQSQPEVGFAQVFSPGVALVYHLPKVPWTIGWALSYSPNLRTLRKGTEQTESDAVRRGLFIAFDIPLFP